MTPALDGLLGALDLPLAFTRTWIAAFGLVVGSFLNVVVHRLPRGQSVTRPRSRCPSCGRQIRWHENIPLVSWVLLKGRCAGCRAPIHWRYPFVEALTGALFLACHEAFGFTSALLLALPFCAATIALVFIDLEHFLLPDAITLPLTYAFLVASFVSPLTTPADALLGILLSWAALEGMNLAYKLVRGRDGFGGGDTKMMLMVSALLGWKMALFTLVAGSFLGVLVGIPALAVQRMRRPPAEAPAEAADASSDSAAEAESEDAPARPLLRDLLPQSLDEALPLLLVPACSAAWVVPGADPSRALAGLLVGIALAWILDLALRLRGLQSPLSRALALAGPFAGLPLDQPPVLLAAAAVLVAALALFRPAPWAAREGASDGEGAPAPTDAPLMQSELPFGVFLGAAALLALLAGERILGWYVGAALPLLGGAP